MTQRLAVFDCDGTLVDGQAHICDSMDDAFACVGFAPPDRNLVRRVVGLSLPVAVRKLLRDAEEAQISSVVEAYKDAFRTRRQHGILQEPLYHGIADLLARLHNQGWLLAVATGKSDRGLNACLETHGIRDMFVSLQTADRHPSKPHPDMLDAAIAEAGLTHNQAVMIGDTTFDIIMARDAQVRALGVAWGYHEPQELIAEGASAVANAPKDLETLL